MRCICEIAHVGVETVAIWIVIPGNLASSNRFIREQTQHLKTSIASILNHLVVEIQLRRIPSGRPSIEAKIDAQRAGTCCGNVSRFLGRELHDPIPNWRAGIDPVKQIGLRRLPKTQGYGDTHHQQSRSVHTDHRSNLTHIAHRFIYGGATWRVVAIEFYSADTSTGLPGKLASASGATPSRCSMV